MKSKFYFLVLLFFVFIIFSCAGGNSKNTPEKARVSQRIISLSAAQGAAQSEAQREAQSAVDMESLLQLLDELAEIERAGSWVQGMALTESGIRESAGDLAGAVAAAYKELSWAYGLGLIQKSELEQSIQNVSSIENDGEVTACANAILAFINGKWDEAAYVLGLFFKELDEPAHIASFGDQVRAIEGFPPDSFGSWMILVCALETGSDNKRAGSAYRSIRARYAQFPEYWYRGARAFSGSIAAEFAENCVNSSPQGPFADECREILAAYIGLKAEDSISIRTKKEIENIIYQSVNSANPQILDSLLPLIGLPDNLYTVYAVNELRMLNSVQIFRDYFSRQAAASNGRLAERLIYISRG